MKRSKDFELVNIADEHLAVPVGEKASTFRGVVTLTEAASFLLAHITEDVNSDDLVSMLVENYEVDIETAQKDVLEFIKQMETIGLFVQ